ncbi:hypothetical protein Tco_0525963 [Tanacetum coccineum]
MIMSYSDKANVVSNALCRKKRVKSRRVRGMILAAQSEACKQENILAERLHDNSKEWNSGDEQLKLRWMIYLVVLADATESVRDAIGFDYHLSIRCASFEALYESKCRSPVLWAEIREGNLIGPDLVLEMTDKVVLIKGKLKATRDRQKSYADNRRKPLVFKIREQVLLKVLPWKGMMRFGKKGKLAPRYVGPFEILERIGHVAYRLRLPKELSEEVDINKKTENQAKMTKLSMEWKRLCKIKAKSNVRQTRAKAVVAKGEFELFYPKLFQPDVAELKDMSEHCFRTRRNQASAQLQLCAPVQAVDLSCVTCGGAHSSPKTVQPLHGTFYRTTSSEWNNSTKTPGRSNFTKTEVEICNQSNSSQNQLHRPQFNQSPA